MSCRYYYITKEKADEIDKIMPMDGGIYKITNVTNNKFYIGSTINLRKRIKRHFYELLNQMHHSKHLQNAWNCYRKESFVYEPLEIIKKEQRKKVSEYKKNLRKIEQEYLDKFTPWKAEIGYNINKSATGDALYLTEEMIQQDLYSRFSGEQFYQIVELLCSTEESISQIAKIVGVKRNMVDKIYHHGFCDIDFSQWDFKKREYKRDKLLKDRGEEIRKYMVEEKHTLMEGAEYFNCTRDTLKHILKTFGFIYEHEFKPVYQFDYNGNLVGEYFNLSQARKAGFEAVRVKKGRKNSNQVKGYKWSYNKDGSDLKFTAFEKLFHKPKPASKVKAVIQFDQNMQPVNYYESFTEILDSDTFRIILRDNTLQLFKGFYWKYENFLTEEELNLLLEKIERGEIPQK